MPMPKYSHRRGAEPIVMGPNGMKLKQIQFRSYIHDVAIYHFQAWFISVRDFCLMLNRHEHGYVDTLLSYDPMLRLAVPIPEGDEVPEGCIEAAYLPNVFQHGGAALGFRVGNNVVEWVCFDRPIDDLIFKRLDINNRDPNGPQVLFHHVANLPKGNSGRMVKGANLEHKGWHDSLWKADHRRVRVDLTWRTFGTELRQKHQLQRLEQERQAKMEHCMTVMDVDADNFEHSDIQELLGGGESEEEYDSDDIGTYFDGDANDAQDMEEEKSENEEDIASISYKEEHEVPVKTHAQRIIYEDEDMEKHGEADYDASNELTHSRNPLGPTVLGNKDTNKLWIQQFISTNHNIEKLAIGGRTQLSSLL